MNAIANLAAFVADVANGQPAVATTPSDVAYRDNKMRLLRYRPLAPRSFVRPILLIPSLINRHYVLDLGERRSFVGHLLRAGHEVYCIDWGTPGDEDAAVSFDHIVGTMIGRAVRHVSERSESGDAHVLGYCLGGTLAAIHVASDSRGVASLTALAAPIDFDHTGIMTTWVRTPSFDLDALFTAYGNTPWRLMHGAFHLLRPTALATKLVAILERGGDADWREGFRLTERWATDNVSFPGTAYRTYIDALYRRNELVRGQFRLNGKRVSLNSITCPVHIVCFDGDTIVGATSALALGEHVGSRDVVVSRGRGSHVGSVVSLKANVGIWQTMGAFWAARDCRIQRQSRDHVATPLAI